MEFLAPLMELWEIPGVKENLEESARLYFSNGSLTINLIPAILLGLLGLFLLKPLFGIPILSQLFGALGGGGASYGSNLEISDGYGAPSGGYGAPAASYGAPAPSYGAPAPSYDAPASGYDAPASGYDAGGQSYDSPSGGYDAPSSGYSAGRRRREVRLPREAKNLYSSLVGRYNNLDNHAVEHVHRPHSAAFLQAEAAALPGVSRLLH